MMIAPQVAAVKAAQGVSPVEQPMLSEAFVGPPAATSSPGVNATKRLALAGGLVVFHKLFLGVHVRARSPMVRRLRLLRDYAGDDGALSLRASGWPGDLAPTQSPTWCLPASLIA